MQAMKEMIKKRGNEIMLIGVVIVLFIFMALIAPEGRFLKWSNIQSMLFQMPEFGLLALGMMAIIVTGGINLSVVMTAALSSIITALVLSSSLTGSNVGLGIFLGIVVCFIVAMACGALNGFVISYIGVVPMLATLGSMIFFEGLSMVLTKGGAISGLPSQFAFIATETLAKVPLIGLIPGLREIPFSILIYVLAIFMTYILLERSCWGTELYMTGCNPVATRFSGVDTKKTLMKAYLFSAFMSALSAIVMLSRYNSAKVDYGSSYLMQSIAAVVLGGTSITGGSGTVAGTVLAILIIQIISNGLNIFGVNRYVVDIVTGLILIGVLALRYMLSLMRSRKKMQPKTA